MFTSVRGLLVGSFDCVFVVRGVLRRLHRLITGLVEPFQKFEIGEKEGEEEGKKRKKREERATLDRYHHFHGHSGMCA
jgi:hypothetical protein